MANLIINRINLRFNQNASCILNISKSEGFWLVGGKVEWVRKKLSPGCIPKFEEWTIGEGINPEDYVCFNFSQEEKKGSLSIPLSPDIVKQFGTKIFIQELASFFIEKGFYVEPGRKVVDFSAYQRIGDFDQEYERYRRIEFRWKWHSEELSYNIGSDSSLISRQRKEPEKGAKIVNETTQLIYNSKYDIENAGIQRKAFPTTRVNQGTPMKFNYKERYENLKNIAFEYLNSFQSKFFDVDKSGMKTVDAKDAQEIFSRQNLMAFGGGKTSVNAAMGMREFGPFKKIDNANKVKLLFIYQNRDDANILYQYLRNGHKHFPGLLSYTGIPVSLPGHKGLKYKNPAGLAEELKIFLLNEYQENIYPETLAIIIGPFNKYESDEEESAIYYEVKQILLKKGISSQFINNDTIKKSNFQYALPNIAIAILAKFGGIPWKLATKRYNELIVGFNAISYLENTFLGSAVFFDNEGRLGRVHGFPQSQSRELILHLKSAIQDYTKECGDPDRLVIHYYKPPRGREIERIENLLKDEMNLPIPFAVVEVNDSKTKLEICFDMEYDMGMPESGTYVRVGMNEYLLFNNNRYQKSPVRRVEEVLPIKVKISFADTGGFHHKELITQLYEFSRIYWKGLKQQSQPVTTKYSKMIADFSSKFGGEIPDNKVAQNTLWFI